MPQVRGIVGAVRRRGRHWRTRIPDLIRRVRSQRTVSQNFRISAVELPPRSSDGAAAEEASNGQRNAVSSEELVEAFLRSRRSFETNVKRRAEAHLRLLARERAEQGELERLRTRPYGTARRTDQTEGVPPGAHPSDEDLPVVAETETELRSVRLDRARPGDGVTLELRFVLAIRGNARAAVADLSGAVMEAAAPLVRSTVERPIALSASAVTSPRDTPPSDTEGPWSRVVPLLSAIATSIGVAGVVTFVGGLIVYSRLDAAGAPAAPAVSVIPSQDLLVIGAATLVTPVLRVAAVVIVLLAGLYLTRTFSARLRQEEAGNLTGEASLLTGLILFFSTGLTLVIAEAGPLLHLTKHDLTTVQTMIAVFIIFVGSLVTASVGAISRRLFLFALTTFLATAALSGAIAYWMNAGDRTLRGAALVREHRHAVAGFFIAEGSSRVYLIKEDLDDRGLPTPGRSRLVGIAKTEVSDLAIGAAQQARDAKNTARNLAVELCHLQGGTAKAERACVQGRGRKRTRSP